MRFRVIVRRSDQAPPQEATEYFFNNEQQAKRWRDELLAAGHYAIVAPVFEDKDDD
jgi:hypothetical protein